MTGSEAAISRPLRAIVMLLFLWAGGRATYEFAPPIFATTKVSLFAKHVIAAESPSVQPNPQVRSTSPNAALPKVGAAVGAPRAIAFSRMPPEPRMVTFRNAGSSMAEPFPQPLTESTSPRPQERFEVQSRPGAPERLSLSSWLLVRDGPAGIAPASTLGGSQVGTRAYLSVADGISVTARVSAPLRTTGAEASAGLALRRGPVTFLLERRVALERGGRDDFSATLVAGVDGIRLPKQFRLDAYGQAGIVGRNGFADGAVRVDRQIIRRDKSEIALGAGVWGGAQPGIARLDAGPQVVVRMPIASGYLRASGEWRQRITGNAQPTSGPALTIGMDF